MGNFDLVFEEKAKNLFFQTDMYPQEHEFTEYL